MTTNILQNEVIGKGLSALRTQGEETHSRISPPLLKPRGCSSTKYSSLPASSPSPTKDLGWPTCPEHICGSLRSPPSTASSLYNASVPTHMRADACARRMVCFAVSPQYQSAVTCIPSAQPLTPDLTLCPRPPTVLSQIALGDLSRNERGSRKYRKINLYF